MSVRVGRARIPATPGAPLAWSGVRPGRRGVAASAVLLTALAALPTVTPGWAGGPLEHVREQVQRVIRALEDPALRAEARAAERRAAIRQAADDLFDFAEITRRVVGHHWQARTPAEREEIVHLFTALLERAYLAKIETYAGEKVVYLGESVDSDHAVVRTRLVTRAGTEIPVDYRLRQSRDRWAAYDVTVEGVSLVAGYRAQFNRILQAGSHAELVRRLRARLEDSATSATGRHAGR